MVSSVTEMLNCVYSTLVRPVDAITSLPTLVIAEEVLSSACLTVDLANIIQLPNSGRDAVFPDAIRQPAPVHAR